MNRLNFFFFTAMLAFVAFTGSAQTKITKKEEPSDFMLSNGKLYVVVAVLVVILIGLFIYLINIDKKISRLEKDSGK